MSLPENWFVPIPGISPVLSDLPAGCRFSPRCQHAKRQCYEKHPELITRDGRGGQMPQVLMEFKDVSRSFRTRFRYRKFCRRGIYSGNNQSWRSYRRAVQMLFQDPQGAFHPMRKIGSPWDMYWIYTDTRPLIMKRGSKKLLLKPDSISRCCPGTQNKSQGVRHKDLLSKNSSDRAESNHSG